MTDFANERSVPYRFVQHEYSQPDIRTREYLHSMKLVASDIMILRLYVFREKLRDRNY